MPMGIIMMFRCPEEREDPCRISTDPEKDAVSQGNHAGESEGEVVADGEKAPYDNIFHQDVIGGQERKS